MSRTDAVLEAIRLEVEARRTEIDTDDGLQTVGIIVKMDARGLPGLVIWRPESQRGVLWDMATERAVLRVIRRR